MKKMTYHSPGKGHTEMQQRKQLQARREKHSGGRSDDNKDAGVRDKRETRRRRPPSPTTTTA